MSSEFSKLGKQIDDAVQNAFKDKDFTGLNKDIKNTVGTVIDETLGVTKSAVNTVNNTINKSKNSQNQTSWGENQTHIRQSFGSNQMFASDKNKSISIMKDTMMKSVGGQQFLNVFALIMLYAFTIASGIRNIINLFMYMFSYDMAQFISLGINVFLMCAAIGGIIIFTKRYKFFADYKKYAKTFSAKEFWDIKKFAQNLGDDEEKVVKRLNKYIDKGYYRDVYLSHDNTSLLVGKETYDNYKISHQKHLEKKAQIEREASLDPIIIEGRKYIKKINAANDLLPDEIISKKLDDLADIITKIFAYLEQRPEKLGQIRKFMDYYLPTTMKLVNSYCEFEKQELHGGNVTQTKNEILEVLDTINNAFET